MPSAAAQPSRRRLGSLVSNPELDMWIQFNDNGTVIVRTGKAELGQGIDTAVAAAAADELGVDPSVIVVEGPSTGSAPNEMVTAGSGSIEQSSTAVRQACAHARRELVARAAERFGVDASELAVDAGVVHASDGQSATYVELGATKPFGVLIDGPIPLLPADQRRYIGHGLPRLDLPAKVRGEPDAFVHDLVLPGMRHARVIRPPSVGGRLTDAPTSATAAQVVRLGSFLAVVADREVDAVAAATEVAGLATWEDGDPLETGSADPDEVVARGIADGEGAPPLDHAGAAVIARARYSKPLIMHGSIGPSAAVALFEANQLAVWSHSQGVEMLRPAIAEVVGLDPEMVSVKHSDGAGCYGHNGADDAALDAALVAMQCPGRPVSLKWTRDDEHGWEPLSPAMVVALSAGVGADGRITSWQTDVYSQPHGARPRAMGPGTSGLLASWYLDPPRSRPPGQAARGFAGGAVRNADPLYEIPTRRMVHHSVPGPLRTSSTRGLGAYANTFAIEAFMDELAAAASCDPATFRLAHLGHDDRARAVIETVLSMSDGLEAGGGDDAPGRGLAFARYENSKTWVAMVVELDVVARTGEVRLRKAWMAADAGQAIDPDGVINQLEGGFVQAASWTLKEKVDFDARGVTTRDWETYPILRFSEVPEITTRLIDHPDGRPMGAGEASTGPTPAAIANAIAQATGARLRDLPFTPDKVKAALAALL